MPAKVRLNKYLRDCNLGSRRKCENLIVSGSVEINNQVVSEVGKWIDPEEDLVKVNGQVVKPKNLLVYIAAHKPPGCLVTRSDPFGRKTIYDAIPDLPSGLFPIGRLDRDSEGLILFTNDGTLAHRLSHPRHEIRKIYVVDALGFVDDTTIQRMKTGIVIESGLARAISVEILSRNQERSILRITLAEGKKREIRQMLGVCGFEVIKLVRIKFGCVALGDLKPGKWRYLSREEIRGLRRNVEQSYLKRLKGEGH
ncbi:MAG: pseudouridine synthase [bacterium]